MKRDTDTLLIQHYSTGESETKPNPVDASPQWGLRITIDGNDILVTEGYIILDDGDSRYHALTTQRPLGDLSLTDDETMYLRLSVDPGVPNWIDMHISSDDPQELQIDMTRPWVVLAEFNPPEDNGEDWIIRPADFDASPELEASTLPFSEAAAREYVTPEGGSKPHPKGEILESVYLPALRPRTESPEGPDGPDRL